MLPEAVFLVERYLSTVRIVSEKLEHEMEWTRERVRDLDREEAGVLHKTPVENLNVSASSHPHPASLVPDVSHGSRLSLFILSVKRVTK